MRFADKVVIVTGGAKGIGEGCARVFSAEGGWVSILDRDVAAGESLVRDLSARRAGRAILLQCDVSDPAALKAAIDETAKIYGRLDCMINNAGSHPPATSIDDTSIEDFEQLLRQNLTSTFAGCKFALRYLRKTKGTIINMASMVGILGQAQAVAYCASKAAQIGLTKALAVDLGPEGIRVNAVLPSNIDTPLMRAWAATLPDPAKALERVAGHQVFGRMGTIEEMGRLCLFLATDDSSFLTGQAIEAEGGASLDY